MVGGGGGVTSVFGEENCEGTLLQQATGIIFLPKLVNLPVIDAVVVPRLLFLILHPSLSLVSLSDIGLILLANPPADCCGC
jgi:hypothetical protein